MKKITLLLTMLVAMVATAMAQDEATTPVGTRLSFTELNDLTAPTQIAIQTSNKYNNGFYNGSALNAQDVFSDNNMFVLEPTSNGDAFYIRKVTDAGSYLQGGDNNAKMTWGAKSSAQEFIATQVTNDGDYSYGNTYGVRLTQKNNTNLHMRLSSAYDYTTATGTWTVQYVYKVAKVTINEVKDETTSTTVDYNLFAQKEYTIGSYPGYSASEITGTTVADNKFTASNENDVTVTVTYTLVEDPELAKAKAAVSAKLDEVEAMLEYIGTGIGEYTLNPELFGTKEDVPGAIAYYRAMSSMMTTVDACNELIAEIETWLSLNMPEAGKFYKIASVGSGAVAEGASYADRLVGSCIYPTNARVWEYAKEDAIKNAAHIFQFIPTDENKDEFLMYNVAQNCYLSVANAHAAGQFESKTSDVAEAKVVKINVMGTGGVVNITPVGGGMLHGANTNKVVAWNNSEATSASAWNIVEVETFSHTLNVTSAGYATLMLGFDATIPTNVKCYIANDDNLEDGGVKLVEVEGVLPANEEVIVIAKEDSYDFTYVADANVTANKDNMLEGSLYTTNITPEANTIYYVLSMVDGEVGLYPADIEATGGKFFNNANKAYLPVATTGDAAQSAGLRFEFGTTGIESVETAAQAGVYYDLSGRRVANPVKGLYIVNGKKVLVK